MTAETTDPPPDHTVFWGKTGKGSRTYSPSDWHPLAAHMVDTLHVADQLWEHYLSPALKRSFLPGAADEELGRAAFRWVAALHDLGKAAPGFQYLSDPHFQQVTRSLPCSAGPRHMRHELMSAQLVRTFLGELRWPDESIDWVADIVGGHHGVFPKPAFRTAMKSNDSLGDAAWRARQRELFLFATRASGIDLDELADHVPGIGAQMAFSGAVILADWLASNDDMFGYRNGWPPGYQATSEKTAEGFRTFMELGEVWHPAPPANAEELYATRFGIATPRGTQLLADEVARGAEHPGLMVVEAPTGEGKTEAALVAAEILAARFGFNGLFFALPTQATTNHIFDRVLDGWIHSQSPKPTIGLAHGKAQRHARYEKLLEGIGEDENEALTASQWMRGAKRALLSPVVIGTIDQLLFAGVSAKHVMLRHTGLANKVVVIDEVHAYDAYMSEILHRVLHWLGWHRVPVVLLSATLPSTQRDALLRAYTGADEVEVTGAGYPQITWAPALDVEERERFGEPSDPFEAESHQPLPLKAQATTSSRGGELAVEFRPEPADTPEAVTALVDELVGDASPTSGRGTVLVLRNTVARAQATFAALEGRFPREVSLAHARFTTADRRRLDADLTQRFGPPRRDDGSGAVTENPHRPARHIVVATQVAEQSLDVDFDVLISDLAPIDLLLQRAGRCHRHARPQPRPVGLDTPRLVVTGYTDPDGDGRELPTEGALPVLPTGDARPYLHHLLFRTLAHLAEHREHNGRLTVPADVPSAIEAVYGDRPLGPDAWQEAMGAAAEAAERHIRELAGKAGAVLIARPDLDEFGLGEVQHLGGDHNVDEDEEKVAQMLPVRHGATSIEVILLRRVDKNTAETVSLPQAGTARRRVPLNRMPSDAEKEAILDQAIRLPLWQVDTEKLSSPSGWKRAPWSSRLRVLLLDSSTGEAQKGNRRATYSTETGWTDIT
ncbi:CRISPR-associated helicase/endonuclease Cas3 [Nocardiopsis gilva YIM 90087]|uniref:CRISPR-associated helicase/endonuclease Cas3 n=1 Tax=Nocardiopsis gilva YIM 90087 TaxID=1235441 RepID=A0A223S9A5_9ACTN|nr:CRISPR-associated helicase/endonuclease Cas3 [Nocardiopsis gilva]ASU84683.1 CRISPR-associated helicase/endonuclease Cas3 [Nocardiopsis gilva YIM 90087]